MRTLLLTAFAISALTTSAQAQSIGQQDERKLFSLSVQVGWTGPPQCDPHSGGDSRAWAPPRGWAIISQRIAELNNVGGKATLDRVAGGPNFPDVNTVINQFDLLMALAQAKHNGAAINEITDTRRAWVAARQGASQSNQVSGSVWAGASGNCGDQKGGSEAADFYGTVRFVGDEATLSDVVAGIERKYGLLQP